MSMASSLSVEVLHSGIWQMTSAVLSCAGVSVVVDPGYFPRELDELAQLARSQGPVTMVAFTHGHWDHIMGWRCFPGAQILVSRSLREAIAQGSEVAAKNLRDAANFDRRWYIERGTEPAWPPLERTRALSDKELVQVGSTQLVALHLPGHSADGLGLWARDEGLLLLGDYLSPCEIPFVEDLTAYRATLRRLLELIEEVHCILPGHGRPLSRSDARAIAEADLSYLEALARCQEAQDLSAALVLPLPRAADVPEMQEHHRENCQAAGFALR